MTEKEVKDIIFKWALDNARKHEGKANPGAVIGKLLSEMPEIKSKLKDISPIVQTVVAEVNGMPLNQQIELLEGIDPELLINKKIVEEKKLKSLKNAEQGNVVLRMAPSPSGPLHIGHAFVLSINSEYAKEYKGKLILRIDDTNPENIYGPAYRMIEEDARWITKDNVTEVVCQSDRLKNYYDYAEKLILKGKAYICTCDADTFREMKAKKQACPCRELNKEEQQKRWDKMFLDYKPGEAVMRIKTDINHPNPALRDWTAFRINEHVHPKQGTEYRVWPLMNFAVACDDQDMNVTHVIRGKDHMDNARKQEQMCEFFGWTPPETMFFGKINFEGIKLSTTETKKSIEMGVYESWEDIRLATLKALKKRGYQPEAFVKFAVDIGLTLTDKTVDINEFFKMLNAHNRDIIEPHANRYFFVWNPVSIEIKNAPDKNVEIALHPDHENRGKRKLYFDGKVYITKDDKEAIQENNVCRLMDCVNFVKLEGKYEFDSEEYEKYKAEGTRIMHWLPSEDELIPVEIKMPDNSIIKGIAEKNVKNLKVGEIIQFERFGFCRLCEKEDKLIFWFTHK